MERMSYGLQSYELFSKSNENLPRYLKSWGFILIKAVIGAAAFTEHQVLKNDRHFRRQESAMGEICQDALFSLFSIVTTSVCIGWEYE